MSGILVWGEQGLRDGAFLRPRAIGVHDHRVYVIDTTGRIQVFTTGGAFVDVWSVPDAENGTPTGVAFAEDGALLVPDTHYSRVLEYSTAGELRREWGSYGHEPGQFIYPTGITRSPHGLFYLSEYGQNAERVQVFDQDRNFVRQWGAHGGEPGQFNRAMAIAMRSDHRLYVADTTNHRVQCFDPQGNLLEIIGGPGTAPGNLKYPHDIAIAWDGSLLVAEYGAHRISRFDVDGRFVASIGKPGRGPGMFNSPRGVAVSGDEVFVADTDNHRIQRIALEAIA